LFNWFYLIITTTTKNKNKTQKRFCNLYLSELGTKLIDDKREEEKVNVYEIKFQSIYRETNSKELLFVSLYIDYFFSFVCRKHQDEEIT
jgi:hypothetical protein